MVVLLFKKPWILLNIGNDMLMLISILSIVASVAADRPSAFPNKRRRRGEDTWVPAVLENFCPWAECRGLLGCSPGTSCRDSPRYFEVKPNSDQSRTCYGYRAPDQDEAKGCKPGPKEDECACIITQSNTLQLGYKRGSPIPDAHISDVCSSTYKGDCPTTQPPPTTTSPPVVLPTSEVTDGKTSTQETAPPTMTAAVDKTTPAGHTSTIETVTDGVTTEVTVTGSPSDEYIPSYLHYWLPALLLLVLIILLAALFGRKRRTRRSPAPVKLPTDIRTDTVIYSPCSDPGSPDFNSNGEVATLINPSYERHVSGNELERTGDFFCPSMTDIPNPYTARGKPQSPGRAGKIHDNPPARLGNFNDGFSEGNYTFVNDGAAGAPEGKPAASGTSGAVGRGSRYEPRSPKQSNRDSPSAMIERSHQHVGAGYEDPDQVVPLGARTVLPKQPGRNKKQRGAHDYEEPPSDSGQRLPGDGARDADGYEVTEVSAKSPRTISPPPSASLDTSYEIASIDPAGAQLTARSYAKVDKGSKPGRGDAGPRADAGYEVAGVPAGHPSVRAGDAAEYAYAYASPEGVSPGSFAKGNTYNVLQPPLGEGEGEYSMLNRKKGSNGKTGHTTPIIMSANEYNVINIPSAI